MSASTYCTYHLGDNLVHLHFLRRVAQENHGFTCTHYALPYHLPQLVPLVRDLPQLTLAEFDLYSDNPGINAWRGTDGFFYSHPQRNDFVAFHLDWFRHLASQLGVKSPITCAVDMLFDYPAIFSHLHATGYLFDVLLINSAPQSNQFLAFDPSALAALARHLHESGLRVCTTEKVGDLPCTRDCAFDVTAIGAVAARSRIVAGVSTGPSWTTFNVWAAQTVERYLLLLDTETVALTPNTTCVRSIAELQAKLFSAL